jgi:hypothetical protein
MCRFLEKYGELVWTTVWGMILFVVLSVQTLLNDYDDYRDE